MPTRPSPRSWDGAPIPRESLPTIRELARATVGERIAVNDAGERVRLAPVRLGAWSVDERETVAGAAGAYALTAFSRADELARRAVSSDELSPRDTRALAGAAKDLAIMGAVLVDKAQLLAGAPTARVERVNADELMRRLGRVLNVESRDST